MNKEIKALWIEALRSGKYVQGMGFLNNNGKFCCLGVLCELSAEAGIAERRYVSNRGYYDLRIGLMEPKAWATFGEYLPKLVQEWAGLDCKDPKLGPTSCTEENDSEKTFDQIASLIEAHL